MDQDRRTDPRHARPTNSTNYRLRTLAGDLYTTDGTTTPKRLLGIETPLGAVAPTTRGGWIGAADTGFVLLDQGVEWLARPEEHAPVPMRMNDAAVDPYGRFWAGSMAYDGTIGAGSLYRLDADLRVQKVLDGLTVPNGPVFDQTGHVMYLAESSTGTIYRGDVDVERGTVRTLQPFAQVEDANPDGMAVDADGYLWSAMWAGSRLHRYAPDGTLQRIVEVPAQQPTSIAISTIGPLRIMVTTATHGLIGLTQEDGRVLIAAAHVAAKPVPPFGTP